MPLDPSSTAVVLIEYQNDFTTDGGVLHAAVAPVMAATEMMARTREVVDAAHAAG
jgi:nicotinamidase-related amidase